MLGQDGLGEGLLNLRNLRRIPILVLALAVLGWASSLAGSSNLIPVVASILPLGDFSRNVGGDRVDLIVMVPPGSSPHTYEPTPARARAVANARLLILNGVGLEFWAEKVIDAASNPDLIVVRTAEGLEIIEDDDGHEHHAEQGHHESQHHERGNAHVWLDPINAIHQVKRIRDALMRVDPDGADIYQTNADRYIRQLTDLDEEVRKTIATFRRKKFISFHAGYSYFARRYGLEQVVVVERTPGREPSPKEIANIVKTARKFHIKAIFAEPQFPPKAAKVIAGECGAEVLFLNPLGDPPHFVYLDTMRTNLHQLKRALTNGD